MDSGRISGSGIISFWLAFMCTVLVTVFVSSCASVNPHNVDVQLEKTAPKVKITSYTRALTELGNMSMVYDTGTVKFQCDDIVDDTGSAITTGGEIQRNITEIMKSTLNSIGGNVMFIEYDPSYIQNQMVTGYSDFKNKVIPDVVITGGITEFDRGLETRGKGTDASVEADFKGIPSWFPSNNVAVDYGQSGKAGKARITLDFNIKDFQTLAGVPKMTTTNSIEVHKAVKKKELGITLFGPTFGLNGSIKKVQGRHEAVRLLVQVSMIQLVGKYLALPYWRLLGDDALPDPVVMDAISETYYSMSPEERISSVQQWLYLYGYDVDITGELDSRTVEALQKVDPAFTTGGMVNEELFGKVYVNIPYDHAAMARRKSLNIMLANMESVVPPAYEPPPVPQSPPPAARASQAPAHEVAPVPEAAAPVPVAEKPKPAPAQTPARQKAAAKKKKRTGFGRKLTEDEW